MNTISKDQQHDSKLTVFQRSNHYEPPFLVLLAAFLCSLFLLCPNAADPDLWGHVRYGQDSLAQQAIHDTTTYSYLAVDQPWINHESIAEWTMGWIAPRFGGAGLMLMKLLLASYTLSLLHLVIRRRTLDSLASCILLVGGAWAMRYYWGTRPQLFSFASFATVLFLMDQGFTNWFEYRTRQEEANDRPLVVAWLPLALLPLVVAFWTNSHGGFIVGLAVISLMLGGRWFQAAVRSRLPNFRLGAGLTVVLVCCFLATLFNPYGVQLLHWIAGSLGAARPEILEWGPWDLSAAGQRLSWFAGLMFLAIAISKKPKDFVELAVIMLITWQSLKHMRHSPFLVMALIAWGSPHLRNSCRQVQSAIANGYRSLAENAIGKSESTSSNNEEQPTAKPGSPESLATLPTHRWVRSSRIVNLGAGGLCLWFGFLLWNQVSVIRVEHQKYPVAAFAFMKQNQIGGRMMITFNWAQYAIDALCPPLQQQENARDDLVPAHLVVNGGSSDTYSNHATPETSIALDGRFRTAYSQNLIDWHFDFLVGDRRPRVREESSGPIDPTIMLNLGTPDLVLLERRNRISCQTMRNSADQWSMLYQDSIAEVWGRKSIYDNPADFRFLPADQRVVNDKPQNYWSAWPANSEVLNTRF